MTHIELTSYIGIQVYFGGIHQGLPAYPGEGGSWKTGLVIYVGILLLNPDRQGRGGSVNLDFVRTSLMDAPLSDNFSQLNSMSLRCKQ